MIARRYSLTTTCISTFKMLKIVHLSEKIGQVFFYKIKKIANNCLSFLLLIKRCNRIYTLGTRTSRPGGCVTLT